MIQADKSDKRGVAAVVGLGLVLSTAMLALYMHRPPAPLPAEAPETEFSANRAITHVEAIAREPHPVGSEANKRVCAYILEQLAVMGIEASAPVETHVSGSRRYGHVGQVRNVVARIPGTGGLKAFAMEAHYDSTPFGPGAADDCSGVAAMLETARALKAGPPLMNDVILVFSDFEEGGLFGARAFTKHPWFEDVGVMLNFEARGTSGPSYMFETSDGNGWLIAEMCKAGVQPRASSIMYSVFRELPFSTDFAVLKSHGAKGFNVAFVEGFAHYHTREDKPENLSLSSLQHHGTYALGLARHFGRIPLDNVTAPDVVYFNTLGSHMAHYPMAWTKPLAGMCLALFAATIVLGFARGRLTIGGLMAGFGGFALCVSAVLVVLGLLTAAVWFRNGHYLLYKNGMYALTFAGVATAIVTAMQRLFLRRIRMENIVTGAMLWWAIALVAMETLIPVGSYLCLWPMAFCTPGLAVLFTSPDPENQSPSRIIVATVSALPGVVLLLPALQAFTATLTILLSAAIAVPLVFLLGLLAPLVSLMPKRRALGVPVWAGAPAIVLLLMGLASNGFTPTEPKLNCVSYAVDFDTGRAFWLSSDRELDEWTSRFFPPYAERAGIAEFTPWDDREYLKTPAPMAEFEEPGLEVVSDQTHDGIRDITLRLTSPRGAPRVDLMVTSQTEVFSSALLGHEMGGANEGWHAHINAFPAEGADILLRVDPSAPLVLKVIETTYSLPDFPDISPRPDHIMCESNVTIDWRRHLRSDHTFSTKTFAFPSRGYGILSR